MEKNKVKYKGAILGISILTSIIVADFLNVPSTLIDIYSGFKRAAYEIFSDYDLVTREKALEYINMQDSLSLDKLLGDVNKDKIDFMFYGIINRDSLGRKNLEYFARIYDNFSPDQRWEAAKRLALKTVGLE